jgi:Putative lumazine-binding
MIEVKDEIREVIQNYLDGLYRCDTELLTRVFHPQAIYATAVDATPLIMNMATYLPIVAQRDPPARQNAPRSERILLIDVVGSSTAFVKLECSFFQKDYTDLLTLIYAEERWQIISKVFHYTPAES